MSDERQSQVDIDLLGGLLAEQMRHEVRARLNVDVEFEYGRYDPAHPPKSPVSVVMPYEHWWHLAALALPSPSAKGGLTVSETATLTIEMPLVRPLNSPISRTAVQEVWDCYIKPMQERGDPPSVEERILMAILRSVHNALADSMAPEGETP